MTTKLFNSAAAAKALDCNPATVWRWATERRIGQSLGGRLVFTAADLDILRGLVRPSAGNPDFGPDFHGRKKAKKSKK